jgi:HEAT repeat protein
LIDEDEIHIQCFFNKDPKKSRKAIYLLKTKFLLLPNKQQAWNDLHRLTNDQNYWVRCSATEALGSVFSHVPDKQQAWNDLHRLTNDQNYWVRYSATEALGSVFSHVPDKQQVWNDLHRLTNDEDKLVRYIAVRVLGFVFFHVPDKQQAWNDLHRLTNDKYHEVRSSAAEFLGFIFSHVPDKQQAWNDLHRLTNDEDSYVRSWAAKALGSAYSQVPDKQQAWNDLHRLTSNKDWNMRYCAAEALGSVFSYVPDKQKAWNDLHRLTNDENKLVRSSAVEALGSAFFHVPDKQRAWNELHKLTNNEDSEVKSKTASVIGSVFSQLPNQEQAWNDLLRLANVQDFERYSASAVEALGSAFSHVPDKQQAWNDLLKLANDQDNWERYSAVEALGSVFSHVPDKQQAWNDLIKLTNEEYSDMRVHANHSLGKVSIFKASQAENEENYKKELENAIYFFEKAAQNYEIMSNPAQFCLPFYRSFYTIIFKRNEAKKEVDKYLKEANAAIKGSESKKQLFEAIKNLADALEEIKNLENLGLEVKKDKLNLYRQYCERAEEFMRDTEETAPFAIGTMRKGLPILNSKLKWIQQNATFAYKESKGTDKEQLMFSICKEVHKWEISSSEEMRFKIDNIIFSLKSKIPYIPENKLIYDKIESLKNEKNILNQYDEFSTLILSIPQEVNVTYNFPDSSIKVNPDITDPKKPFIKKITNSIIISLGIASTFFALSYPVCEIYSLENKNYIYIGVFIVSFLFGLLTVFVIIEK